MGAAAERSADGAALADARWLKAGVASVWLTTGILVAHPLYRAIGASYLSRLHVPEWSMPLTCLFEIALAGLVLLRPAGVFLTLLQLSLVTTFTVILALHEPRLLVSPFGMLTKNVPILTAVAGAYLLEREGWSGRVRWLLRVGMASIWITEGLFPKILFQQPEELWITAETGLSLGNPALLLRAIGACQLASGVLVLLLRGRPLRVLLGLQALALVVLPLVVSLFVPWLWFHPFGPFTKNVAALLGTLVLYRRCSSWS